MLYYSITSLGLLFDFCFQNQLKTIFFLLYCCLQCYQNSSLHTPMYVSCRPLSKSVLHALDHQEIICSKDLMSFVMLYETEKQINKCICLSDFTLFFICFLN